MFVLVVISLLLDLLVHPGPGQAHPNYSERMGNSNGAQCALSLSLSLSASPIYLILTLSRNG